MINLTKLSKEKEKTLLQLNDKQITMFMEQNERNFLDEHYQVNPVNVTDFESHNHFNKTHQYRELFLKKNINSLWRCDNGIIFALSGKLGDIVMQANNKEIKDDYKDLLSYLFRLEDNMFQLLRLLAHIYMEYLDDLEYSHLIEIFESSRDIDDRNYLFKQYLKRRDDSILNAIVEYFYGVCLDCIKHIDDLIEYFKNMNFKAMMDDLNLEYTRNAYEELKEFVSNLNLESVEEIYDSMKESFNKLSEDGFSLIKEKLTDDLDSIGETLKAEAFQVEYDMEIFEMVTTGDD